MDTRPSPRGPFFLFHAPILRLPGPVLSVGLHTVRIGSASCVPSVAPGTGRPGGNTGWPRDSDRSRDSQLGSEIRGGAGDPTPGSAPVRSGRGPVAVAAEGQGPGYNSGEIRGIGRGAIGLAGHRTVRGTSAGLRGSPQANGMDPNLDRSGQAVAQRLAAGAARSDVLGRCVGATNGRRQNLAGSRIP